MIPIFEPKFGDDERKNLIKCIDSGWISSQGDFIPQFEKAFARWNGVKYGVTASSCTTALHLALVALGIGAGDEVLCPDLTFIAPANMIRLTGASPILIDVEEPSWAIDPEKMEERITSRTRAIMVVHPFGHAANMGPIMEIANKHNLAVIEDVAEAPGAEFNGQQVGTFGVASCYSFFANKIMTTGEGGMVLTGDISLDKQMRIYRDHGMSRERRYVHVVAGYNYRMTNMQAAIGMAQLSRLDDVLTTRFEQAKAYQRLFDKSSKTKWRPVADWCQPVHWMSTITLRSEDLRGPLLAHMKKKEIDCRQMVYPIHMAEPYRVGSDPGCFPVSRSISLRSLHLPSSIGLTKNQMEMIAETALEWLEQHDT